MATTRVAAIQMSCVRDINENLDKAERLVRKAAAEGAKIILLPELFERQYFCQERRYDYYRFAKPVAENDAVRRFKEVSKELSVVLPVSIYERDVTTLYNTVVMLDSGENLGIYRKTHIPDDHFYQEKFYFTPGDTGLILEVDSAGHWTRTMQGHSAANIIPVAAANRYGLEEVLPSEENAGQRSALSFYGSSFMTDETGKIIAQAGRDSEEILFAEYDFETLRDMRLEWGVFRDRRPEMYKVLGL